MPVGGTVPCLKGVGHDALEDRATELAAEATDTRIEDRHRTTTSAGSSAGAMPMNEAMTPL